MSWPAPPLLNAKGSDRTSGPSAPAGATEMPASIAVAMTNRIVLRIEGLLARSDPMGGNFARRATGPFVHLHKRVGSPESGRDEGPMAISVAASEDAVVPPVRVLVVDDSSRIRGVLRDVLELDGRFRVVGEAAD